jgi:lipopolysaccharide transport protein LptA
MIMRSKKALKLFIIVSLLGVIIYVFAALKRNEPTDFSAELKVDGEKMTHYTYDKNHRRVMELKSSEAVKESDDKLVMKDIEGLVFKKGRMNKDIRVFGDHGYVANNSHNFYVEKNARITSDDFDVKGPDFFLKDQANITTKNKVRYEAKDLKGIAMGGLEYYLKINVLKFFNTRGRYHRDERDFSFKTDILWVIDDENLVLLEKRSVVREGETILRSGWLSLHFTDNFKRIVEAASQKNSYFFTEDPEKNESKEIKADNITSYYDEHGKLTKVKVMQNGVVSLTNETNHTIIHSDLIEMRFDPETGKATGIAIPGSGQIENTGKTDFRITAQKINADYNEEGELTFCQSKGNSEFIIDDYKGISEMLSYDIENDSIILRGPQAQIISGTNTFNSTRFNVDTENKVLTSGSGVKSVILLKKKNVLFSQAPLFVNADNFTILEKENKFSYKKKINLVQDDIGLKANSLSIADDNRIEALGGVSLSFKSDDKELAIKGGRISFNAKEKSIEISDNAAIKSDENLLRADRFVIQFTDKNEVADISGEGEVSFTKEDLYGHSGSVSWLFKEETMILRELPQVVKKNGGTTMVKKNGGTTIGKELKINLKTNKITILSSGTERTETIIK